VATIAGCGDGRHEKKGNARVTIGILGGGQLGSHARARRVSAGSTLSLSRSFTRSAGRRIATRITAQYDDRSALKKFAAGLELVTYEFENVPVEAARFLAERVPVLRLPPRLRQAEPAKRKAPVSRAGHRTTEFCGGRQPRCARCRGKADWLARDSENVPHGHTTARDNGFCEAAKHVARAKSELPRNRFRET